MDIQEIRASEKNKNQVSIGNFLSSFISKRSQRIGKEIIVIGLGQAMAMVGGLVGVRILTELLNPKNYGQLALAMTMVAFTNKAVFGPISGGAMRYYASAAESRDANKYIDALKGIITSSIGILISVGGIIFFVLWLLIQPSWLMLGIFTLCFAIFSGLNSILNSIQNAARRRITVALHQGLASWSRFTFAAALIFLFNGASTSAMIGYSVAMIIVLSSQLFFFRKNSVINVLDESDSGSEISLWRKRILNYSWPFVIWSLVAWAQDASGRWALQFFGRFEEIGLYAVLYQLGVYPIILASTLILDLVAPILYEQAGDASNQERMDNVFNLNRKITFLVIAISGIVFVLSLLLHEIIFSILVAVEYRSVSWLFPIMIFSSGIFAASQSMSLFIMSETKTYRLIAPKVITAFAGILLSFLGAYSFGVAGVVAGYSLFTVFQFAWIAILVGLSRRKL